MKYSLLKLVIAATRIRGFARGIKATVGVLKELAPYAAIELVLPGGTLLAILCWLYRRRRVASPVRDRKLIVARSLDIVNGDEVLVHVNYGEV